MFMFYQKIRLFERFISGCGSPGRSSEFFYHEPHEPVDRRSNEQNLLITSYSKIHHAKLAKAQSSPSRILQAK